MRLILSILLLVGSSHTRHHGSYADPTPHSLHKVRHIMTWHGTAKAMGILVESIAMLYPPIPRAVAASDLQGCIPTTLVRLCGHVGRDHQKRHRLRSRRSSACTRNPGWDSPRFTRHFVGTHLASAQKLVRSPADFNHETMSKSPSIIVVSSI